LQNQQKSTPFSVVLNGEIAGTNVGRELVFSADLCYNKANEKASPFGRGGGEADGEGKWLQ